MSSAREAWGATPDRRLRGRSLRGHGDPRAGNRGAPLAAAADRTTTPRPGITFYHTPDGRRINLLSEGRLVDLTGPKSEGHPAEVMDITFSMTVRAAVAPVERDLPPGVHGVPTVVDREVAERKLAALGLEHDELTDTQEAYPSSWRRDW